MRRILLLATAGLMVACGRTETAAPKRAVETLLAHLPQDTEAVVAGSLIDLARWPLWRRLVGVVAHELPGMAERITTHCKLDPWSVLDNAALAFTTDTDNTVLVAQTTSNRARLHECVTQVGGNEQPITVEDGPITKYQEAESTELAAWFDERVFLTVPLRMDELEVVEPLLPARPVPEQLKSLLARADRDATLWGIAVTSSPGTVTDLVGMIPLSSRPIGVHGAIRRGDGLRAHVALVFADAAGATEAARLFESLLANPPTWIAPWRDALRVEAHHDEARVRFELGADRARLFDDTVIALLPKPSQPPERAPAP